MDQLGNTICIPRLAIGYTPLQAGSSPEAAAASGCRLGLALFILTMVASQGVLLMVLEVIEIGRPVLRRNTEMESNPQMLRDV